jgi:hypothetical protein
MISKFSTPHTQNLNLKYCERCGHIWLRRSGSKQSLCSSCAEVEAAGSNNGAASFLRLCFRLRAEVEA